MRALGVRAGSFPPEGPEGPLYSLCFKGGGASNIWESDEGVWKASCLRELPLHRLPIRHSFIWVNQLL